MLGFPVALKINSPDISHKSEVDGMRFDLHNDQEVLVAYEEILTAVKAAKPEANLLGVTVQTQEQKAICELIVGSKRDPDFGPLILFGAGGEFTEVLEDSAVDLPPLNLLLARRLIEKTRVSRVLKGYRNLPPSNLDQLAEILVRISQLVTDFPEIVELDVNPLLAVKGGFVAVDARLIVEPTTVPAPRHLIIAPYPNQYESDWLLRDGTPVLLRPMKPEDEPLVSDFLGKCSEETIYFRYFKLIKKWTHEMLIRFTQVSGDLGFYFHPIQQITDRFPYNMQGNTVLQRDWRGWDWCRGGFWYRRGFFDRRLIRILRVRIFNRQADTRQAGAKSENPPATFIEDFDINGFNR